MCTISILIDVVDGAPLVIAANRDELYARPTRSPEVIARAPVPLVGGVDEQSGGTWMAVRADARFAAVTNQRALAQQPPGLRSRGHVVRELALAADPSAYLASIDPAQYASMNLVFGAPGDVRVAYARRETATLEVAMLGRGVHVLCNDALGAAGFPRGERLHDAIDAALANDPRWEAMAPRLAIALGDHTHAPVTARGSHLPPEIEHELTATCIHTPTYGTRSATLLAAAPGRVLAYRHADGPPCRTPFADRRALLEAA